MFYNLSWMILLHLILMKLQQKFQFVEEKMDRDEHVPTVCVYSIVNIFIHITEVYYGIIGLYNVEQETVMGLNIIRIMLSNFIYDFILCLYGSKTISKDFMFHHIFGLVVGIYMYIFPGKILHFLCIGGLQGASTIVLDIILIFRKVPSIKKKYFYIFTACKIAFACLFIYLRIILHFQKLHLLMTEDYNIFLKVCAFVYTGLNMYWGFIIISKLINMILSGLSYIQSLFIVVH